MAFSETWDIILDYKEQNNSAEALDKVADKLNQAFENLSDIEISQAGQGSQLDIGSALGFATGRIPGVGNQLTSIFKRNKSLAINKAKQTFKLPSIDTTQKGPRTGIFRQGPGRVPIKILNPQPLTPPKPKIKMEPIRLNRSRTDELDTFINESDIRQKTLRDIIDQEAIIIKNVNDSRDVTRNTIRNLEKR